MSIYYIHIRTYILKYYLNGSLGSFNGYLLKNCIFRCTDITLLTDYSALTVSLEQGIYIFVNAHINARQITMLMVHTNVPLFTQNILPPTTSEDEVVFSSQQDSTQGITIEANGVCRGRIYNLNFY